MILLYTVLFLLIALVAMTFSYYVGLRTVGVKASIANTAKLALILLLVQGLVTVLSYSLGDNPVTIILWLAWLIGAFILWHKLLNRYHHVGMGKSLGAYITAGIVATIVSAVVAFGAIGFVQSYKIDGNIMHPTLRNGDMVLAYKHGKKLEVNKVVIYNYNKNGTSGTAIGRILYTPGQTVSVKTNFVDINSKLAQPSDYTLKADEYYVVGDNKNSTLPRVVKAQDIVAVVGPTIVHGK